MSQERWDVVLRFQDGPLSYQGDVVCRGPVVRMGASPGPGALVLDGYRGLDSVQATITAYDGGSVAITPMGTNQVRVATHENVDWAEIQTLRAPVYLSPGDAFHLGSPNRGVTITFVECRRLGVWQQRRIISDASQAEGSIQPTNIKELDAQGNIPRWFIPAVLVTSMLTMVGILVPLAISQRAPKIDLGPPVEGVEYVEYITAEELGDVEQSELDGFEKAFDAFIMAPNATAAGRPGLRDAENWDPTFYRYTVASLKLHRNLTFFRRLESIKNDYAYVVEELRKARLPTVFAAIPYQESQYKPNRTSPVCAKGYWQFMPETAFRYDLAVRDCKIGSAGALWSPTRKAPPPGIFKNAEYVYYNAEQNVARCMLQGCAVDDRVDLQASTRAAIAMLQESWLHEDTQASGAGVQMAILAHNMGFDDDKYLDGGRKYGILKAYRRHTQAAGQPHAPHFYGANITCDPRAQDPHKPNTTSTRCGGYLPNQTQHYGYNIVAQHLLAVCYYGLNYNDMDAFEDWDQYVSGYCSQLSIPESDQFREGGG